MCELAYLILDSLYTYPWILNDFLPLVHFFRTRKRRRRRKQRMARARRRVPAQVQDLKVGGIGSLGSTKRKLPPKRPSGSKRRRKTRKSRRKKIRKRKQRRKGKTWKQKPSRKGTNVRLLPTRFLLVWHGRAITYIYLHRYSITQNIDTLTS